MKVSPYRPGQRVEINVYDGSGDDHWIPATLVKIDGHVNYEGCQWTFQYPSGRESFCIEKWIRPLHALIQLAELAD